MFFLWEVIKTCLDIDFFASMVRHRLECPRHFLEQCLWTGSYVNA